MYFWYSMCFCLMLCLSPEVTQGLSFVLFFDNLLKGNDLLYATDIFWLKTNMVSLTFLSISSLSHFISPIRFFKLFLFLSLKILTFDLSVNLDLVLEWSITKFTKWSLISVIKLPELMFILEFLDKWKIWSISVQVWLVTLAGSSTVEIKPFLITVFRYSLVLSFKSNFIKSMLKSPVNMLCFVVLSFSIVDNELSNCSVNSLTLPLGWRYMTLTTYLSPNY